MNDEMELIRKDLSRDITPEDILMPTQQELDELYKERIMPETDLPPMTPLFQMFGVPCFYRGELVAICGKAKSSKTIFASVTMAAALTQKILELERYHEAEVAVESESHEDATEADETAANQKPLKVLWLDTEQSQQSTQGIMKARIIPLCETSEAFEVSQFNDYMYAFNLRGLGYERRRELTKLAIHTIKPDLVVIDGVKDLMTDINDAVQATIIMEDLMKLAQTGNCCITCVLHLNKSEQDGNMRGSIGTELTNKAFEVFLCEMLDESGSFSVSQTYSRKERMNRRLYYNIDKKGIPVAWDNAPERIHPAPATSPVTHTEQTPVTIPPTRELFKIFYAAMENRTQRPYGEVMGVAFKKHSVPDSNTYYAYFKAAEQQKIVRVHKHPETGENWVELVQSELPF